MGLKTEFRKLKNKISKNAYENLIEAKFKKDEHYSNANIEACFKDRTIIGNDDEILKRIAKSYNLAIEKQEMAKSFYKVSNEWLPIYKQSMGNIMNLLKTSNISELQKTYDNFWRDDCSSGLLGLPEMMQKDFFKDPIKKINKKIYLNDVFHRYYLWKDLLGYKHSIDDLKSPIIGNPYGIEIEGEFLKHGCDYLHYYATVINRILEKNTAPIVAELGGGYGGMAYYLNRDCENLTYIDVDLPENLALASYYLLKCFPEKKIVLYGEAPINEEAIKNNDIVMLPAFAIEEIPDKITDLFFNSYSLAEMDFETIANYINQMDRVTKKYFYHVNHTTNCVVGADNFPVPKDFTLLYRAIAQWNLGRKIDMDEYEYLYMRG